MTNRPPRIPDTAWGDLVREMVWIDGRKFRIDRPSSSDLLLDYPAVVEAFQADEYIPYWADLWPCARMLAKAILRRHWPPQLHGLEIGCGLGLVGIAALAQGMRITFSDYDPNALRFAAANARLNGFHQFETLLLDWRQPPTDCHFPVIFASDVCYENRHVEPLVGLLQRLLTDDGECWLADQDRPPAPLFRQRLIDSGFTYQTERMRVGVPGGERFQGTIYTIRRKTSQRFSCKAERNN